MRTTQIHTTYFFNCSLLIGITDVENLKRLLSFVPSEYSYFDSKKFYLWRGPDHWKFTKPKFPTNVVAPKAVRHKSKEPLPHDFKALYTNEFKEEALTIPQVNRILTGCM